jgi:hypothetical protein
MIKLTPVLAVAVAVLFTSGSPAAFAQPAKPGTGASSTTASSYSPPIEEHKKKPRKPKKAQSNMAAPASGG